MQIIEESTESGYRVVCVANERTYQAEYWVECRSKWHGRAGEWVKALGPYARRSTAIRKMRERVVESK